MEVLANGSYILTRFYRFSSGYPRHPVTGYLEEFSLF